MKHFIFLLLLVLAASKSFAQISSMPPMYKLVAGEQKIPAKLFYAMILNESKSAHRQKNKRKILPWPWTVNHRGKGYFFQTRLEAFHFVERLIAKKDFMFDVGLGQMSWYWHRHRFNNVWDAFDPYVNLTAAAKYLREQYERKECNSWEKAIGCYHRSAQTNKDKKIAENYATRVIKLWEQI